MDREFLQAFSEIIRDQILLNNEVRIDGVGCFCSKHYKQHQKRHQNGRVVMMPPENTIRFIPEK